ncbi:MAG: hypothetical protein LBN07_05170 [Christensenellaceae bacterium]|jgi:hypothetical protein|nr:hypothetical protein [Christensenellaceae bacterium]
MLREFFGFLKNPQEVTPGKMSDMGYFMATAAPVCIISDSKTKEEKPPEQNT